jgi:hypothetical protein
LPRQKPRLPLEWLLLPEINPAQQVCQPRIASYRIKNGVNLQDSEAVGTLGVGALQPQECSIEVAQADVSLD